MRNYSFSEAIIPWMHSDKGHPVVDVSFRMLGSRILEQRQGFPSVLFHASIQPPVSPSLQREYVHPGQLEVFQGTLLIDSRGQMSRPFHRPRQAAGPSVGEKPLASILAPPKPNSPSRRFSRFSRRPPPLRLSFRKPIRILCRPSDCAPVSAPVVRLSRKQAMGFGAFWWPWGDELPLLQLYRPVFEEVDGRPTVNHHSNQKSKGTRLVVLRGAMARPTNGGTP